MLFCDVFHRHIYSFGYNLHKSNIGLQHKPQRELNMSHREILVHIDEELKKNNRDDLSKNVTGLNGVESVDIKDQLPHLMIVAYNDSKVKALELLNGVRHHGVNAQIAGWL